MPPSRVAGVALLELLVAVFVFAIMAGAAYAGLDAVVRGRADLERAAARLKAQQLAVDRLAREIGFAAARPVRGRYGETLPALEGAAGGLELTHHAFAAEGEPRAALARSAWRVDARGLVRASWPRLDRGPAGDAVERVLLEDVGGLRLRYLDGGNAWRDRWPPRAGADAAPTSLPRAIEFRIVLAEGGELLRLIEMPEPVPAGGLEP